MLLPATGGCRPARFVSSLPVPVSVAPWIVAADFETDPRLENVTLPPGITATMVAQMATDFLFEMSGERFPGVTSDTIRPHQQYDFPGCNLANLGSYGGAGVGWGGRTFPEGRAWCGCPSSGEYIIPNSPVIVDSNGLLTGAGTGITVDGAMLGPLDYRVYDQRRLVRMLNTSSNAAPIWYCHQLLMYPLTMTGTWSITYQHGVAPPQLGWAACREVAIVMAVELGGGQSRVPAGTKQVTRQGTSITIVNTADALKMGMTELPAVNRFLQAYNPGGYRRRAQIWTPHLPSGATQ